MLAGETAAVGRQTAFIEYDYSALRVRLALGQQIDRANFTVAITDRWKLIHFPDFAPILFDLDNDPLELTDLGTSPAHAAIRTDLTHALLDWSLRLRRVTESAASIDRRTDTQVQRGIWLGLRNATEHAEALAAERVNTSARLGRPVA